MASNAISKYCRIAPEALQETTVGQDASTIVGPAEFVAALRPRHGLLVASWDQVEELGRATRFGVVLGIGPGGANVRWSVADQSFRPSPSGRRWWKQAKPFFSFAPDVVARYMLDALFAEHFTDMLHFDTPVRMHSQAADSRPSNHPTGGYVYLVRSQYGVKIGKSVNVKSRTRLFEVKLPFPISVEHYAWFDDYSYAERDLHKRYHAKRLEGEWFDLSKDDIAQIKTLGRSIPFASL